MVGRGLRLSEVSLLLRQDAAERYKVDGGAIAQRHRAQGDESKLYPLVGVSVPTSVSHWLARPDGACLNRSPRVMNDEWKNEASGGAKREAVYGAVGGVHRKESASRWGR